MIYTLLQYNARPEDIRQVFSLWGRADPVALDARTNRELEALWGQISHGEVFVARELDPDQIVAAALIIHRTVLTSDADLEKEGIMVEFGIAPAYHGKIGGLDFVRWMVGHAAKRLNVRRIIYSADVSTTPISRLTQITTLQSCGFQQKGLSYGIDLLAVTP